MTSIAGHASAPYWSSGIDERPLKVGTFSMLAFEMVGPDCRQHAHRLYLAPDGRGKAEIVHPETGEKLDPNKLMPVSEGEPSTAGLALIFGDTGAPTCLVTEDIETAAAVAYACQAEIASKNLYVAAAITAGGVETFRPWPNTKTIIVMADGDERAKGRDRKASRRGEEAARKLCLRLHGSSLKTFIALPGEKSESVDWLDILLRDGAGVVREGVSGKELFEPTAGELREQNQVVDPDNDDRPTIEIQPGKPNELVDECAAAIGPTNVSSSAAQCSFMRYA